MAKNHAFLWASAPSLGCARGKRRRVRRLAALRGRAIPAPRHPSQNARLKAPPSARFGAHSAQLRPREQQRPRRCAARCCHCWRTACRTRGCGRRPRSSRRRKVKTQADLRMPQVSSAFRLLRRSGVGCHSQGPRFSSGSALWPSHDGIRRMRRTNLLTRPCRKTYGRNKDSKRTRLIHRPCGDIAPPVGGIHVSPVVFYMMSVTSVH